MTKVTIVIPARNEEKYIEQCIFSFLNQTYNQNLITILVCDGLSDDRTREIVSNIAQNHSNVQLLDNQKQTTPYALNLGITSSSDDIVIIFGAHAKADSAYVQECIDTFKIDPKIACVGGVIENIHENKVSAIISGAMSSQFGVGNAHFRTGLKEGFVDTVAFGAYKRSLFDEIGMFDETLTRNQDDEFNYRLHKFGFKIYLNKKIKCQYFVRGSMRKLFRQYFQYGFWKVVVNKKHSTVTSVRQLAPLFFVSFLMFFPFLLIISVRFWIIYVFILALYFIIISTASLRQNPIRFWFTSMLSFLTLHLAYGSGYLWALINWPFLLKNHSEKHAEITR